MSLSLNTLCVGNLIERLPTCPSTNDFMKNRLSKSEPMEGLVLITDKQTDGKGQIGNKWQSNAYENLTFSIFLKPIFLRPAEQFMLSKIVSLACVETLSHFANDSHFAIKWPNDIFYQKQKMGGILIENSISHQSVTQSVVGIGLNINQTTFVNLPRAISLRNIVGKSFVLEEVLVFLLKKLDVYYLQLKQGKYDAINKLYLQNLLGYQKEMLFTEKGILFKAKVLGVSPLGELILQKEDGKIKHYYFKEIVWRF